MTSTLQEQLQRLAAAAGVATKKGPRGKPSLLYTFQEAADVGIQDIYAVALQGFDQLCRVDPRFQSYRKTLFSQATLTMDRDQQTAEVNSKLDASIAGFCALLSSYFLLPAAFKSLEYLVRRFKANERNVDALMHAALPYHATNEFVRLVQILQLDNTPFAFLEPMQKSGVALPRPLLVQRCLTDRTLLRFICDAGKELGGPKVAARSVMPFFGALLCEIVAAAPAVDENLVSMLLPYIVHGLSADVSSDYRAAIYMMLVQLATRATFSSDLVSAAVLELCKSATPAVLSQVLLVLCHLAVTQPELKAFPENAFKYLAKLPGLAAELKMLASKGPRAQTLLGLVGAVAATHIQQHDNYAKLMDELLSTVPWGQAAAPLAEQLMNLAASGGVENAAVVHALRALDLRYPQIAEKAVNDALQRLGGKTQGDAAAKECLTSALHAAFAGSLRAPMLEAGTTLALAVDAASAGIRRMALEKLDALAMQTEGEEQGENSAARSEAEEVLRGALLRRLGDDHPAVVQAALNLQSLLRLPPAAVLESLSLCLAKALVGATQKSAKKSDRAASRGIARKVVKILAGPFVEHNPEDVDRAAELILACVLSAPHTRKVAESAVKKGKKVDHPLLQALANAKIDVAQGQKGVKSPTKATRGKKAAKTKQQGSQEPASAKGYDDALHNKAVVEALAQAAASDKEAQAALGKLLSSSEKRTKALALAVANVAMRLDGGAPLAAAVLQRFASEESAAKSTEAAVFDPETGFPDGGTMLALASGSLSPGQLEPAVVLSALRLLPNEQLKAMGREGLEKLFNRFCALSAVFYEDHLDVLVARAGEIVDAGQLLADLWGAPSSAAPDSSRSSGSTAVRVQTAALRLWTQAVLAAPPASPSKAARGRGKASAAAGAAAGDAAVAALPRLLCVLSHSERSMRTTAVAACGALAEGIDSWWPAAPPTSDSFSKSTAAAVLGAIFAQAPAIEADSEAAENLLRSALEGDSSASPQKKSIGARKKKAGVSPGADVNMTSGLAIDTGHSEALKEFLLVELPKQRGPAALNAVPFVVNVIHDAADPAALLLAGCNLLSTFAFQTGPHMLLLPLSSVLERSVAAQLVGLYNDAAMSAVLGSSDAALREKAESVVESLLAMLHLPAPDGSTEVRRAALQALTPVAFEALPSGAQRAAFVALTAASTQDSDQSCRDAAHTALVKLPLTADILLPLLSISGAEGAEKPAEGHGATQRRNKRRAGATSDSASTTAGLSSLVATLEVLQWKDDVADSVEMVPRLQSTLGEILNALDADNAAQISDTSAEQDQEAAEESGRMQAAQAYAMQLALALLNTLTRGHLEPAPAPAVSPTKTAKKGGKKSPTGHPFDIGVAVRCAQAAPDAAVRSAALSLIGVLAAAMPQQALDHVLTVVSVVGDASSELIDAHSSAVAAQSLGAVASAWVNSGGDIQALVDAVVGAVAAAPAQRRLPLLKALSAALPDVSGLCLVLLALLNRHLAEAEEESNNANAEDQWQLDAARVLLQQGSALHQAQTMAALLEVAMDRNAHNPAAPIVLLSTAFVTTRLEATAARLVDAEGDEELQAAYELLMQRALSQLQRAGELGAEAAKSAGGRGRSTKAVEVASPELLKTATKTSYALIEALHHVMTHPAYVEGLVGLINSGSHDKVRRRALSLLTTAVLAEEGQRFTREATPALAKAALAAVQPVLALASGATANTTELTQQIALGTLGALAQGYAAQYPQQFIAAVPAMLELTKCAQSQPVRGSALACIAAMAQALGRQMVPVLPPTVQAVLTAAKQAAEAVAEDSAAPAERAEGESDEDEDTIAAGKTASEAAALELAAALSALASLVNTLGAFLAPHLPQLFLVLFNPAVLACQTAHCSTLAASIRSQLAKETPMRLLLAPLAEGLQPAAAAGPDAACALLSMLRIAIESMDSAAVTSYHESVFMQLLRALDLRRTGALGSPSSPAVNSVEVAAVHALVELTMKLSETKFKPLFFRLVEWATSIPPLDPNTSPAAASPLPRAVALLGAANALSERLRSVFTPYFQPLLDPIIAALDPGGAASGAPPKKKKAKKAASLAAADGDVPAEVAPLRSVLRLLAVRALHRCFLHDTTGFLDEARFEKLMAPLLAQLHVQPTEEELLLLLPEPALESSLPAEATEALDVPARALIACLAQMALASGGGDARWRPLNHSILMATRSPELRTRLTALEGAAALANALQEEYLPLLPEALPFLAELLEDGEHQVEARAAATVKALEALSGEDLKEYLK